MKVMVFIVRAFWLVMPIAAQQRVVADPPAVHGPFTLMATYGPASGHNAFAHNGATIPPVIRVLPGGVIKLHYVNHLPIQSDEMCATGRCTDITNLHFHGLHVSPESAQDDVLTMMAMPGETLDYKVVVSLRFTFWAVLVSHASHGESARQDLDGMSGAIIVEGIDRYDPELRQMRERVLILRDHDLLGDSFAIGRQVLQSVENTAFPLGICNRTKSGASFHRERRHSSSHPNRSG